MNKPTKTESINPFVKEKNLDVILRYQNRVLKDSVNNKKSTYSESFFADKFLCAKLYRAPELERKIFNLGIPAQKLFLYILLHIGKAKDYIQILPDKIEQITSMKESSFNVARSQLVKANIIRKKKGRDRIYWVNPHYIFHGNRPKFYDSHINQVATYKQSDSE